MNTTSKFLALSLSAASLVGLVGCSNQRGDLGASNGNTPSVTTSEPLPAADVVVVSPEVKTPEAAVVAKVEPVRVAAETAQPQNVSTRSPEVAVNATVESPATATPATIVPADSESVVPADLQVLLKQWQGLPESAKSEILTIIKTSGK